MADHTCRTDTPYPRFLRDLCYSFFFVFVHVEYSLSLSFCSILTSDHVLVSATFLTSLQWVKDRIMNTVGNK
jgi:hypothetical protein